MARLGSMDVCSSYRIRQWYWIELKAFLWIKSYSYQHQNITIVIKGENETYPNFWNRHNNFLSKFYRFIWSCRVVFNYWTWFFRLAALVCLLMVVPFVIFCILFQQFQEKKKTSSQKYYLCLRLVFTSDGVGVGVVVGVIRDLMT